MQHILVVEDDGTISSLLQSYLEREDYRVTVASTGTQGAEFFQECSPDLVILDINLPGKTGFDLCQMMRESSQVPILMLSARTGEDDRVRSLELGADDFIPKPFSVRELLARVARHLKRSEISTTKEKDTIQVGRVTIFPTQYRAEISGQEVRLTKTEFELISHLSLRVGVVVERDTLMKEIIGYERYLSDRTIDTHMKNLRKKFEGVFEIETLRAIGYRLHIL